MNYIHVICKALNGVGSKGVMAIPIRNISTDQSFNPEHTCDVFWDGVNWYSNECIEYWYCVPDSFYISEKF